MDSKYYFDVLPVRRLPKRGESLCSLLGDVIKANAIQSYGIAVDAFFEGKNGLASLRDCTPHNLPVIATFLNCPEPVLKATTFSHLCNKFGCPSDPHAQETFLFGAVSPSLRYCSHCLSEDNYYRLLWRFKSLKGCPVHECELFDRCGNCESPVPLFAAPFQLGICPTCGTALKTCVSSPLDGPMLAEVIATWQELEFLLAPHASEAVPGLTSKIGFVLSYINANLLAKRIKEDELKCLEEGGFTANLRFTRFLKYRKFLHISYLDVFALIATQNHSLATRAIGNSASLDYNEKWEREFHNNLLCALHEWKNQNPSWTNGMREANLSSLDGRRRDGPDGWWDADNTQKRVQEGEQKIFDQLQEAIDLLQGREYWGIPMTAKSVCDHAGISPVTLRANPGLQRRLDKAIWDALYNYMIASSGAEPSNITLTSGAAKRA